jgi:hypothetical protein
MTYSRPEDGPDQWFDPLARTPVNSPDTKLSDAALHMREIMEDVRLAFENTYPDAEVRPTIAGFTLMLLGQAPYPHIRVVFYQKPDIRVRMRMNVAPNVHRWPKGHDLTAEDIVDKAVSMLYLGYQNAMSDVMQMRREVIYNKEPDGG